MTYTIPDARPWFAAKLAASDGVATAVDDAITAADIPGEVATAITAADIPGEVASALAGAAPEVTAYTAATISDPPTDAEVQAVADALEALYVALESGGLITFAA